MAERSPDTVIIGGGAIGCAIAWELARRGALVTVIERGTPGREATWAAGGMLSPLGESARDTAFLALATASFDRYPAFIDALADSTGQEVGYSTSGKFYVAFERTEEDVLDDLVKRGAAFQAERLSGEEARRREPSLSPKVRAAVFVGRDHRVDNRRFGAALWSAAARTGVDFRLGASACEVLIDSDGGRNRARGVRLETGTSVPASAVVIAAGAWSGVIAGLLKPLPVRPVRGQMFAVSSHVSTEAETAPLLEHVIMTRDCYIIPRDNGPIVVGATVEEVGFTIGPTPRGISGLLAAAVEAVPAIADLPLIETWAGFRPGSPDRLPILGPDPDVAGLFYATGHYRNGILLTPVTAQVMADVITGRRPTVDIERFGIGRFCEAP
ncbi:MAG: glycine oxidase ThiO [Longimicrobiales bacterium]